MKLLSKYKFYIIGAIALIISFPILVNTLMSFQWGTAYGNTPTWITFFGSYIGSIFSGLLTLIGVLLTINYTVEHNKENEKFIDIQNKEHIESTRVENMKILQENKINNRRNKLPEMIYNLEECLDFLEEKLWEVEDLQRENIIDTFNKRPHERPLNALYVSGNYFVEMNEKTVDITKLFVRKIRAYAVKADVPAYDALMKLKIELEVAYDTHISPISNDFYQFSNDITMSNFYTHNSIIIDLNSNLSDIQLTQEEQDKLIDLKTKLYQQENEYVQELLRIFWNFDSKLKEQLNHLVIEYNS